MIGRHLAALLTAVVVASPALAQGPVRQTQEDDYTRYELLGPDTAQFRILYEVTGTTAGARFFFNAIRKGSIATDERVTDMMTGQPLKWEIVSGAQARSEGHPTADLETEWLKVHLARPIPKGGEARVLIDKTYKDPKSYFRDGDAIVFDRSLGIRRNAVVLPAGYRLISCNVPSQVMATADGRVMITFMNSSAAAAPLVIRAKAGLAPFTPKLPVTRGPQSTVTLASEAARLADRAHQDREIVYFPNDPATHSFDLYHDYTESRPGVAHYFNVVRAGSSVSNPSAMLLDTGEPLKVETISGLELKKRNLDAGEPVSETTQIVVI
ncbi:MAG TPA: hypothetical protein VEC39_10150, partial [Vicinamibacterales bacterium]|nr:hypothetical protein [Vicinamibacterales bacterium]